MRYVQRTAAVVVERAAAEFPAVVVTGPRQAGKTTLLRRVFGSTHGYVSLELPDVRASAAEDPRGFLAHHDAPIVFDEVQYAPELLPYIKERIDEHRDRPGQYVLTGSQNLLLMERVNESLAGRTAILELLPLTVRELAGRPASPLPWETVEPPPTPFATHDELWRAIVRGGYPEIASQPDRDVSLWHASYVRTYLERDVRLLRSVGDLTQFHAFLRALAARSAQLLNMADLSRDLGLSLNTVKAWISVLEASHQIIVLRPYFANIGKRLVKTPKVYFTDTGTLCHLVGLGDAAHAAAGPMAGVLFETAVVAEIRRTLAHRGERAELYFWRTSAGAEVDLLVDLGQSLVPIEVKTSATPRPAMVRAMRELQDQLGDRAGAGFLVHPGDSHLPLGAGVTAIPLGSL